MVEYTTQLDLAFGSLADPTRRDMYKRVISRERTISELAEHYKMSFAAVAKHLNVLERAMLIDKRKNGRKAYVSAKPESIQLIKNYLNEYELIWSQRLDSLEELLKKRKI